jgi:hypothetical protein
MAEEIVIGEIAGPGEEHQGFIYGGVFPGDNKPIWVSPIAPKPMTRFQAVAWASRQDAALPTIEQGAYLKTLKDQGAFRDIFNQSSTSRPNGAFWLNDVDHLTGAALQPRTGKGFYYCIFNYEEQIASSLCLRR